MRGDWNVSIRRACHVFLLDTSTYHYKSRRPGQACNEGDWYHADDENARCNCCGAKRSLLAQTRSAATSNLLLLLG